MTSHTLNSTTGGGSVFASELLDLIRSDAPIDGAATARTKTIGRVSGRGRTGTGGRGAAGVDHPPKGGITTQGGGDPFSVRLTPRRREAGGPRGALVPIADGPVSVDDDDDEDDDDSVGDMLDFDSSRNVHSRGCGVGRSRLTKHAISNGGRGSKFVAKRQRMPLGGGYGGMFESHGVASVQSSDDGNADDGGSSLATSRGDESSSVRSVFTFASRLFSSKRRGHRNPYTGPGHSVTSHGSFASGHHLNSSFLVRLSQHYLRLPFRLRYFLQMFSIVAAFMLAFLNYFIAMENKPATRRPPLRGDATILPSRMDPQKNLYLNGEYPQPRSFDVEGGGASPNQIPRLRVRDPLKFLHNDLRPNELLERATAKFRQSTRFGDERQRPPPNYGKLGGGASGVDGGEGPFVYGWRSMPRMVYYDFATGLSDDSRTIEHSKNSEYFKNKAQKQVGPSDNYNLSESYNLRHENNDLGVDGEKRASARGTVAYVLPITSCFAEEVMVGGTSDMFHPQSLNQPKDEDSFRDFALMLRSMIHAHSWRNAASGSSYDYSMHAILHPRAKKCRSRTADPLTVREGGGKQEFSVSNDEDDGIVDLSVVLQNLGYHVTVRYPPLERESIRGSDYLRDHVAVVDGGGHAPIGDLIRLYAYEMEGYDAVALVDYDTLILGPVDEAVDLIVDGGESRGGGGIGDSGNGRGREGDSGVDNGGINAVFSWENLPSLVNPGVRATVVNLSFLLLRPSRDAFADLVRRYQSAPFSEARGWGRIGRGPFPGWMATAGFLTYYYDEVANAAKVEMSRCVFGNTGEGYGASNSVLITNGGRVECGGMLDAAGVGTANGHAGNLCTDCSKSKFEEVSVADLSYCVAPWVCSSGDNGEVAIDASFATAADALSSGLCRWFQKMWFSARLQMEDVHPQLQKGSGTFCAGGRYQPMLLLEPSVQYRPTFLE